MNKKIIYDLVTFDKCLHKTVLKKINNNKVLKRSYPGREPGQSLTLIVHEHFRLSSGELIKHVEEEVPFVDIHHLSVILKLHLGRTEQPFV